MTTLKELYDYLESWNGEGHIESMFPYTEFIPIDLPKVRLEMLTWWKIENIVKDEKFVIDKNEATTYLSERYIATNNLLLKYRYSYFAYLLSNNNLYAHRAVDALLDGLKEMLPDNKEEYPHRANYPLEVLMTLSKRVKYRKPDVRSFLWQIFESEYGYRTKLLCLRKAKHIEFFDANDAERLVLLCKDLFPLTKDGWREACCTIGLHYASKLQNRGMQYIKFFYELLGDIEMEQLKDPVSDKNNIAIPHMNDSHLEKAMAFYEKAGSTKKRNNVEKICRENKKKLIYPQFRVQQKTNEKVVEYFNLLKKELLEERLCLMLMNLSCPVRFMFPSYQLIKEYISKQVSTWEQLGFENQFKDINGNTKNADKEYDMRQKYGVWLMDIVENPMLDVIQTAIQTKKLTYAKLKRWMLKDTCFGIPIEYARANHVVSASWFSQVDYGLESLMKQYQRFIRGKTTDWRMPIDILAIRFEGIIRDIVADYGGKIIKVGKDNSTSMALLESLLKEPCLCEAFRIEDIEFFEYVFTNNGLNIRNNVAHSFYIPQDYGIFHATLVFLCILRLTLFSPKEKKGRNN